MKQIIKLLKGGPGSGNFDHAGRPGEIGGSGEGGSGSGSGSGSGGSGRKSPGPAGLTSLERANTDLRLINERTKNARTQADVEKVRTAWNSLIDHVGASGDAPMKNVIDNAFRRQGNKLTGEQRKLVRRIENLHQHGKNLIETAQYGSLDPMNRRIPEISKKINRLAAEIDRSSRVVRTRRLDD